MSDAVKISVSLRKEILYFLLHASFDLFENYEDRGNQFKKAVQNL
jgi:UDP-N-acetylmuramoylalanine--D-glutamate ligase